MSRAEMVKTLAYYFVHKNPVAFRDYYMPRAMSRFFKTRYYQVPAALDDNAILKGGRRYGKSKDIEPRACQFMINSPGKETLLTAFRRIHVEDRSQAIISYFLKIPYWRSMLQKKSPIKRSPAFEIRMKNGHVYYGISVGDDPLAVNIQGKNPALKVGEEFASYPSPAFKELASTVDPTGCDTVYGGTTDGRVDTPFAKLMKMEKFHGKVYAISRRLEPHFDQETKKDLIDSLGPENSDNFMQQVDALDGEPVYSPWNLKHIYECMVKGKDPLIIEMEGKDFSEDSVRDMMLSLPNRHKDAKEVILAVDLGWSEPTVICAYQFIGKKYQLIAEVRAYRKMISQDVQFIIHKMAGHFGAEIIPIDCTNNNSVATGLQTRKEYKDCGYKNRIVWVGFNETMKTGEKEKDPTTGKIVEKTEKVKVLSTRLLRDLFGEGKFLLPMDEDIIRGFDSEREKVSAAGRRIITTPRDVHITEVFRCFAIGWFVKHGKSSYHKKEAVDYSMVLPQVNTNVVKGIFGRTRRRMN